jgi:hypothetical protein
LPPKIILILGKGMHPRATVKIKERCGEKKRALVAGKKKAAGKSSHT